MGAAKRAFRARPPPILTLSTRYQTVGMSQSATPATQNDMTTCLETFEKERFCSFPYRRGNATGKPETRDETRGRSKTRISCETSSNFDTFDTLSNWLECHKMPRLPTQNDMTTCLETFEKERFCSFPHRHGINDATATRRRRDGDATTTRRRPDEHSRRTRVQPPDPQTINGNPSLRIREKGVWEPAYS